MSKNSSTPVQIGDNSEFTIALSEEELRDITENKMRDITLDVPQDAIDNLSDGNKRALIHLLKAAEILDAVFLKQDHPANISIKQAFEAAASRDNPTIQMAHKLFTMFNSHEGINMYAQKSEPLRLIEGLELPPGKGFYPQDITKEELVDYLTENPQQASAILGNNTIVQRNGDKLEAVPYSVAYAEEMNAAATELLKASQLTDHSDFATYLQWQAQALVNDSDPEVMFNADKTWINLEDAPLEFTISREGYEDRLSADAATDPKLAKILNDLGIKAKSKDTLGIRVGITDMESYEVISNFRAHLDGYSKTLPSYGDEYKNTDGDTKHVSIADVNMISLTGRYAAIKRGMTLAANLPNPDKLAVQLNEGGRIVIHKQPQQQQRDPLVSNKLIDSLIDVDQKNLINLDADFLFIVGHELSHSVGPKATKDGKDKSASLGKWGDIVEENKADVSSICFANYISQAGDITENQLHEIYMTWIYKLLPAKEPSVDEPHNVRSLMQLNYFREKGAIHLEEGEKVSINPGIFANTLKRNAHGGYSDST
ncbi:MAG: hypothetical protein AAF244_04500 [Pseudomonadota bacterium]